MEYLIKHAIPRASHHTATRPPHWSIDLPHVDLRTHGHAPTLLGIEMSPKILAEGLRMENNSKLNTSFPKKTLKSFEKEKIIIEIHSRYGLKS